MVTHGLSPSGFSYYLLGGTGRGCTMTQTHPTSEVAALVSTGGGESLCCPLLPPHPFLSQNCSHPLRVFPSTLDHASEISRGWTVGGSSKREGGARGGGTEGGGRLSGELLETQLPLLTSGEGKESVGPSVNRRQDVRLTKRRLRSRPRLGALRELPAILYLVVLLLKLQ